MAPNVLTRQRLQSLFTLILPGLFFFCYPCLSSVQVHLLLQHLFRPDSQIPLHCGTPAAYPDGDRESLYHVKQRPPHAFTGSRNHTLGELLAGYDNDPHGASLPAGHDQDLFDDTLSAANLPNLDLGQLPGRNGRQRQRQHQNRQQNNQQQNNQQQQGPPMLSNGYNLCYAAASFHTLERVEVNT